MMKQTFYLSWDTLYTQAEIKNINPEINTCPKKQLLKVSLYIYHFSSVIDFSVLIEEVHCFYWTEVLLVPAEKIQ